MSTPSTPLSPDDGSQENITIADPRAQTSQPYLLTALMAGFTLFLLMRGLFQVPFAFSLNISLVAGAVTYLMLITKQPPLSANIIAIVATELGALYSLPQFIYTLAGKNLLWFSMLLWSVIFAGLLGWLLGFWLKVDDYPQYVIPICFLSTFVLVNILSVFIL